MVIEILNDSTIQGHKRTIYWAFDQPIYFYMQFSKPFTTHTLVTDSAALDKGGELLPQMKALLRFLTGILIRYGRRLMRLGIRNWLPLM